MIEVAEATTASARRNRVGAAVDAAACTAALVFLFTLQFGQAIVTWGVPSLLLLAAVVALLGLSLAWRILTGRLPAKEGARAAVRAVRAGERIQWGTAVTAYLASAVLVLAVSFVHHGEVPLVAQQRAEAHVSLLAMAATALRFIVSAGVMEEVLRAGLAQRLARAAGSVQRWPWWALVASTLVWASAHAAYGYPPAQLAAVVGVGLIEAWAFRAGGLWTAVVPHAAMDILSVL